MEKLNQLEKKVANKVENVKVEDVSEDTVNVNKLHAQLDAVYRLISNTNNRQERKLNYMDAKLDSIIKAIENSDVGLDEIKKQEEIKKLEQQLNKLKGEN